MAILATAMIIFVALLHLYFLLLEMFFWDKPLGMRTFGLKPDFAQTTKTLAANQGLYNGFLAAGLLWGLILDENAYPVKVFFLSCIVVAGVFGGLTANRRILYIQALPALLALILTWMAASGG